MGDVKVWVSVRVTLDEVIAKRHATLVQAGITKTEIIRRALVMLLSQGTVPLLTSIGLAERLEKPELVTLDKGEYEPVPEPEAVAAGQGKK